MGSNGSISTEDFINSIHLLTHLARHNMEERFVDKIANGEISFVQMNLMRVLGENPGRTVGEVAAYMNVSYPAATKTIDKLVRLGFVKRKEDNRDRRIAHLQLTHQGQKVVEKYTEFRDEQIKKVLKHFEGNGVSGMTDKFLDLARALIDELGVIEGACLQCGAFSPEYCKINGSGDCGYLEFLGKGKAENA